jgi:phosphoribosylformimino-5-aminoimidazole carboxamide ribotide isomerase
VLLIPAIDLHAGRCVRLHQGNFWAETEYRVTPVELLRRYRNLGAQWLHVVDLDGARDGTPMNGPIVAQLAKERDVRIQVGGGVRSAEVIEALISVGVDRVVVGSVAVERPSEVITWLNRFGPERFCLAFDVQLDNAGEPRVCTRGWTYASALTLWDALRNYPVGSMKHVLCTDIARDGTLRGPNVDLYRAALERFPHVSWQASGGVRHTQDLRALADLGLAAAVSGKALLEERMNLKELRPFLPVASSPA